MNGFYGRILKIDLNRKNFSIDTVAEAVYEKYLVRFGCIKNDYWRSAGRTGAGTVLGSKKIKGILFTGNRKRPQADEAAVKAFSKDFMAEFKDHAAANAYRTLGTPMLVKMTNTAGAFPTRYWTEGIYKDWEKISAEALIEKMDPTPHALHQALKDSGKVITTEELEIMLKEYYQLQGWDETGQLVA